jgi:hypothetical protein
LLTEKKWGIKILIVINVGRSHIYMYRYQRIFCPKNINYANSKKIIYGVYYF